MIKKHWLIIAIICLATWLRTWQLADRAILFSDAAHDLLAAAQAVEQRQLPLLGIPSSEPLFKQGPLTVWLEMAIYLVADHQLLIYSLVFAGISLAAVIGVYEFAIIHFSPKISWLSAALIATSPLAVAHGRVVYHITPIPLMLVLYLFSLMYLSANKPRGLFWAILAWCGLFQFELALTPLILLIPFVLWRKGWQADKTWVVQVIGGLLVGLLPQVLFDLTHHFAQLGGFAKWILHRSAATFGLVDGQVLVAGRFQNALSQIWLYGGRVVSTDQVWLKLVMLALLVAALIKCGRQLKQRKLPIAMEICVGALGILSLSFLIHGSPSEAYFPAFVVLLPLIIAYGVGQLRSHFYRLAVGLVCLAVIVNVYSIVQHHFFVSNLQAFTYSASVAEQRQIVEYIHRQSQEKFQFSTTRNEGVYPSFFDNLRWVAAEQGLAETKPEGETFFIETKTSALQSYPSMKKVTFPTWDVYQVPTFIP